MAERISGSVSCWNGEHRLVAESSDKEGPVAIGAWNLRRARASVVMNQDCSGGLWRSGYEQLHSNLQKKKKRLLENDCLFDLQVIDGLKLGRGMNGGEQLMPWVWALLPALRTT